MQSTLSVLGLNCFISVASGPTGFHSQPTCWWNIWTCLHNYHLEWLQRPDPWQSDRGHTGQVWNLFVDGLPHPVETEALQRAAAKASAVGTTTKVGEPKRLHPHGGHRSSHESEGVPQSGSEEPTSAWDLLKNKHFDQNVYFNALVIWISLHQWCLTQHFSWPCWTLWCVLKEIYSWTCTYLYTYVFIYLLNL